MSETVSVIIPAYNAASRIRECLDSVIEQDYPDIEIIVVDDASDDGTGDIARGILGSSGRKYQIMTHSANMGVSAARNTGLEALRGEYVCFVDADDVLRENFISCLHSAALHEECDVVFCGLTDRFTDGRPDKDMHSLQVKPYVSTGENFILGNYVPPLFCCIYRTDLIRRSGLSFLEGCTSGEDTDFITIALCRAEKVTFIRECLYIYMHHDDMGSVRDNNTRDKKILRYEHNTLAQLRTAKNILEYAQSRELKDMAGKVLMPQNVIRRLNIAAMKNDMEAYRLLLSAKENTAALHKALGMFTLKRKPEVFLKALMILLMPGIYYRMRKE